VVFTLISPFSGGARCRNKTENIMSDNSTFSPALTSRERTAVPAKSLSFIEGVSMIVGTNIGAGVLSIAYASSKAGFLPLLFWLVGR
jgi:hypothetical protein